MLYLAMLLQLWDDKLTYPFRVELCLNPRHNAAGSDDDIINIGQHFSEAGKVGLEFDVIVVEYDT